MSFLMFLLNLTFNGSCKVIRVCLYRKCVIQINFTCLALGTEAVFEYFVVSFIYLRKKMFGIYVSAKLKLI